MKKIKSESTKRLILRVTVNDKPAYFLIDTGASTGIMDNNQIKKYDLKEGRKFGSTVIGAGGEMNNVKYCNTFVNVEGRVISQFLLADISDIVKSIKRETDIEILGIIGLPQMKMCGISIDCNDNEIILE